MALPKLKKMNLEQTRESEVEKRLELSCMVSLLKKLEKSLTLKGKSLESLKSKVNT